MRPAPRILLAFHLPEALRDILEGIAAHVRTAGLQWQVECVDPRDFYAAFRRRLVAGAITGLGLRSAGTYRKLRTSQIPAVNVLRDLHPHLPSVLSDNPAIGRAGARYLLERGFRRFAFAAIDTPWSRARMAGFAAELADAGLPAPLAPRGLRLADFEYTSKVRATRVLEKWARALPEATAVMAPADFIARALVAACRDSDIAVPDQVAVLGVDNFHGVCELSPVPLSSVGQDFQQIGRAAAALLEQLMASRANRPAGPVLVSPGKIHVRRSTDVFAFEDPLVVEALRIIHAHASTAISMRELLTRVPLSRKWLDFRFKALVGRTPSEEIRRCRLEVVRDLLAQSDVPLKQIAARCRFSCVQNLVRSFRVAYGSSPSAYRRQVRGR